MLSTLSSIASDTLKRKKHKETSQLQTLPDVLIIHALFFLTIHELGGIASCSQLLNCLSSNFLFWNPFLKQEYRSILCGVAKQNFINQPQTRLPKFMLIDDHPITKKGIGRQYVTDKTSVLARSKVWSQCYILKNLIIFNFITMEEAVKLTPMQKFNLILLEDLIIHEITTLENVKNFSAELCEKLKDIQPLLIKQFLTIDNVKELSSEQCKTLRDVKAFIIKQFLTVEEALRLTHSEFLNLEKDNIQDLVMRDHLLTMEQAKTLQGRQCFNLARKGIENLIKKQILTLEQVMELPLKKIQRAHLASSDIQDLILHRYLTISDVMKLKLEERKNLAITRPLILKNVITVEQAKCLTKKQRYHLSCSVLQDFLIHQVITLDKAMVMEWSIEQYQFFSSIVVKNLILKGTFTFDAAITLWTKLTRADFLIDNEKYYALVTNLDKEFVFYLIQQNIFTFLRVINLSMKGYFFYDDNRHVILVGWDETTITEEFQLSLEQIKNLQSFFHSKKIPHSNRFFMPRVPQELQTEQTSEKDSALIIHT